MISDSACDGLSGARGRRGASEFWPAHLGKPKVAMVTCMDPRLSDLEGILGLKTADMDVIRTGGPAG